FFFQAEDGIRDATVTGVQTCALPIFGPIVKALEYATGRRATVIGKPSPLMFQIALRKANCDKRDAVMIGDQVETDIVGARKAGVDSILVLTGVDKGDGGGGRIKPSSTVRNIDDLAAYL